ncbi:hypothetical protein [Amycolatopsis sp. lyj-346]|uniref:hypothetical protein n=1 Tax=Amycolatopsis sp. lyj-346 TaxID=2789289 RepID=UPI0039788302
MAAAEVIATPLTRKPARFSRQLSVFDNLNNGAAIRKTSWVLPVGTMGTRTAKV